MARKGSPTILQEELYAPGAERLRDEPVREELDDARLVDLDVDEESPFLRAQKRVSARRATIPKKAASRLLWAALAAAALGMASLAYAAVYRYGERSWRFRVQSSDDIEITGMQNVPKGQIMEVMGADIGRNIFFIPLAQQKTQLEQIPWVESASVMRFVPNRLKVEIHERVPVAFARVGPRISLIDAGGTLMELPQKHKYSFPVILGMNPGEPLSTRAPRMKTYRALVGDLDSGGARYAQDLSEVDLSDLEDVKVRVNDPAGDVLVHLGSSNYLQRYKVYVSHVREWRQQFQKLESVDLRYDNQIIVNPDLEGSRKQTALTAAAAKAAAAAGVKPAALITRTWPHDRRVPKPAFELAEKKLNGAGRAAHPRQPKKPTGAAKGKRVAKAGSAVQKPDAKKADAKKPEGKTGGGASAQPAAGQPLAAASVTHAATAAAKPLPSGAGQKPSPAIAKGDAKPETRP